MVAFRQVQMSERPNNKLCHNVRKLSAHSFITPNVTRSKQIICQKAKNRILAVSQFTIVKTSRSKVWSNV